MTEKQDTASGNETTELDEAATVRSRRLLELDSIHQSLADKGEVILRVQLSTKEEAAQLFEWMYGKNQKLMLSSLVEISFDKELVHASVANAFHAIIESVRRGEI